MNLQLSEVCPECESLGTMLELDSDFELISPETFYSEAEYKHISLKEECSECGFNQTKNDDGPDPDSMSGGKDDY